MKKSLLLFITSCLMSIPGFGNTSNHQTYLLNSYTKNYSGQGDSVKIVIPNIFTPNGDGKNDHWSMIIDNGLEIFDMETTIYNRWGKQVFESTNIKQNWNGNNLYEGNACAAGSYFYVISYTDGNNNETKTLKGFLEIIR
jgi:gliding motility-associated-like protein